MKVLWWIITSPFRLLSWIWRRTRKSYTSREDHVTESEESMRRLVWHIKSGKDDDDNGNGS